MKKNKDNKLKLQLNRQAVAKLSKDKMRTVQGGTGVITGTLACTTIVASGGGGNGSGRECTKYCFDLPHTW